MLVGRSTLPTGAWEVLVFLSRSTQGAVSAARTVAARIFCKRCLGPGAVAVRVQPLHTTTVTVLDQHP